MPRDRARAVAVIAGTRISVLALGALAVLTIGTWPPSRAQAQWRVAHNELANLLARWDTYWYTSIATGGYHWDPTTFSHQNVVFSPLYPFLMRWVGFLIGGHPIIAGLVISLASFGGAAAVLYRLAVLDIGQPRAWSAILLLSTYPFAFFFSVAYTEALFLFVVAVAFYAMRRDQLWLAALAGFAAGLTRPNGFWLGISLLFVARSYRGPRPVLRFAVALAPFAGTALYSAYLLYRFGDPLAWVHGQAAWGLPLLGRASALDPGEVRPPPGVTDVLVWTGNIVIFFAAMWAVRPVFRRFGAAYASLIVLTLIPPVLSHLFMSVGRFASVLFPLFFWLATVIPEERVPRVAAGFAVMQAVLAVLFFLWLPVV
jgi:hypothetical protein